MHMYSDGRVAAGQVLPAGGRIGHPSCEGGYSYASLPNIMKAKKKPIDQLTPDALGVDASPRLVTVKVDEPPKHCRHPTHRAGRQ